MTGGGLLTVIVVAGELRRGVRAPTCSSGRWGRQTRSGRGQHLLGCGAPLTKMLRTRGVDSGVTVIVQDVADDMVNSCPPSWARS